MRFRKLAVLAAALMTLTSCSGKSVELMDFIGNTSGKADYEGLVFTIADAGSAGGGRLLTPDQDTVMSVRCEMLFERYKEIEEDYNCTIKVIDRDDTTLNLKRASGSTYADFLNIRLKELFPHYKSGYILPINEIPAVDTSDGKYGTPQLLEALTWKNDTVAVFPQYWGVMTPNFSDGVYFNPEVFAMINYPTPHELTEQGKWDWDALEDIGEACASISTPDKPMYMSTLNNYFARMMLISNGGEYIVENSEGKYEYGLLNDDVISALEKANEFYVNGYLLPYPGSVSEALQLFVQNQIALIAEYSVQGIFADGGVIGTQMQGAYGWAYNPRGPKGGEQITGLISSENQYIAATVDKETEIEALGSFMETLFQPLGEEGMDWTEDYLAMNFYDDISTEVFMTKFENTVFDKVLFAYTNDTMFEKVQDAAVKGDVRKVLESIQVVVNAQLDENIN